MDLLYLTIGKDFYVNQDMWGLNFPFEFFADEVVELWRRLRTGSICQYGTAIDPLDITKTLPFDFK